MSRTAVWRWLVEEHPYGPLTTRTIAQASGVSLATARHAMEVPVKAGAIRRSRQGWEILDRKKLLLIAAVFHRQRLAGQMVLRLSVYDIEGWMLPAARFTGPSAVRLRLNLKPSDYRLVWVYVTRNEWPDLEARFQEFLAPPGAQRMAAAVNLRAWIPDAQLPERVSWCQVYWDLWNAPVWWSVPYLRVVEEAMGLS